MDHWLGSDGGSATDDAKLQNVQRTQSPDFPPDLDGGSGLVRFRDAGERGVVVFLSADSV
jgi:hypothetical protein